jgi:hypothetical protein
MVWGLSMPSSFGDFFPNGDYVGWDEELTRYFNEEMPAEEQALFGESGTGSIVKTRSYIHFVAEKFKNEYGSNKLGGLPPITPIEAHETPKRFETVKTYTSLGSLVKLTNRILAVDETLKDIIERLEPGVHHFFPLQITIPKKQAYPKRYYVMAVGQYLDSFSPEKSNEGSWRDRTIGYYTAFDETKKYLAGLAFSKSVFGKAHLWRERHLISPEIIFSDELQAEIAKAGLRLPKHYQMKAV